MKYKGEKVKGRNREVIPFPREGGDIIFIAEAVQDWSEFEKLVSEPKPPTILKPGGTQIEDRKDPKYIKEVEKFNTLRTHYLILKSIENTPDLVWETVDINKPETWENFNKELQEADFTEIEISRILVGVMRANSLDERMIDEARANFLHGKQGSEK